MKNALEMIADERDRQLRKGFDSAHDDVHANQEILHAAGWIMNDVDGSATHLSDAEEDDPDASWMERLAARVREKYGDDKVRRLVIAGAMIVAEINRLQRLSGNKAC